MGRRFLSSRAHAELFAVPTDSEALIRHYLLSGDDIDLIHARRRAENHLGLAVHISLLRYPGLGWSEDIMPPAELIAWEHIILSGDFDWHSGAAERKIARPLNIRPVRNWGT